MEKRKSILGQKKKKFGKRHCLECGKTFQAKRRWHEFCSKQCRMKGWQRKNINPSKVAEHERRLQIIEKKLGITGNVKTGGFKR